jgi:hypothetical protein
MRVFLTVLATLLAQPSLAAPQWQTSDSVYAGLAAVAGSIGGGLSGIGVGLGYGLARERGERDGDLSHVLVGVAVGGLAGSSIGSMAGVSIYAERQGFDGSRWASLGGAVAGMALGGLAGASIRTLSQNDVADSLLPVTALVLGQATGAVLGYVWTLEPSDDVQTAHGGLLEFDRRHGLRLGVPVAGVQVHESGLGLGLTLAAGTW